MAKAIGISTGYMSELVGGTKSPTLKVAAKIAKVTGGQVPIEAWLDDEDTQAATDISMPPNDQQAVA